MRNRLCCGTLWLLVCTLPIIALMCPVVLGAGPTIGDTIHNYLEDSPVTSLAIGRSGEVFLTTQEGKFYKVKPYVPDKREILAVAGGRVNYTSLADDVNTISDVHVFVPVFFKDSLPNETNLHVLKISEGNGAFASIPVDGDDVASIPTILKFSVTAANAASGFVSASCMDRAGDYMYLAMSNTMCLQKLGIGPSATPAFEVAAGSCALINPRSRTRGATDGAAADATFRNILALSSSDSSSDTNTFLAGKIFIVENAVSIRTFDPTTKLVGTIFHREVSATYQMMDIAVYAHCIFVATGDYGLQLLYLGSGSNDPVPQVHADRKVLRMSRSDNGEVRYATRNSISRIYFPTECTVANFEGDVDGDTPWTIPDFVPGGPFPTLAPTHAPVTTAATLEPILPGPTREPTFAPTPEPSNVGKREPAPEQDDSKQQVTIILAIVGSVMLVLVAFLVFFCVNQHSKKRSEGASGDSQATNEPASAGQVEMSSVHYSGATPNTTISIRDGDVNSQEFAEIAKPLATGTTSTGKEPLSPAVVGDTASTAGSDGTGSAKEKKPIKFKKGRLIGTGGFGRVYIGLDENNGNFIAGKEIVLGPSATRSSERAIIALQKEIHMMKKLKHENLVRYLGADRSGADFLIFMEYVPGGTLRGIIEDFGSIRYSLAADYTRQILRGLAYVHDAGVVHRDIKAANILIDIDGVAKIGDFGASRNFDTVTGVSGTPYWMAPEAVRGDCDILSWQSDIWSLGCTVIEMLSGKTPFEHIGGPFKVMYLLGSSDDPMPIPNEITDTPRDFIIACLERDPAKRPSAADLLLHPFIKDDHGDRRSNSSASLSGGGGGGGDSTGPSVTTSLPESVLSGARLAPADSNHSTKEQASMFARQQMVKTLASFEEADQHATEKRVPVDLQEGDEQSSSAFRCETENAGGGGTGEPALSSWDRLPTRDEIMSSVRRYGAGGLKIPMSVNGGEPEATI